MDKIRANTAIKGLKLKILWIFFFIKKQIKDQFNVELLKRSKCRPTTLFRHQDTSLLFPLNTIEQTDNSNKNDSY